ncbi:MAG: CocE/NonD family hydrolase C-terminal non-catalytic domain-containing protein, partial [Antricoccus sp.]
PIAHTFEVGHRIRLLVTSSSFPRFSRNLNSRVSPEFGTAADIVIADQVVHHDVDHPSRLTLPQAC